MNTITIVLIQVKKYFKDDFGVLSNRLSILIVKIMGGKICYLALTEFKNNIYHGVMLLS